MNRGRRPQLSTGGGDLSTVLRARVKARNGCTMGALLRILSVHLIRLSKELR